MPSTYTYPGVYIEEIPSGVRTITGVSTSDTAFVGHFSRGPMNKPVRITSFSDFERQFGGLRTDSEAGYAILQYYLNGGQVAWVIRTANGTPTPASLDLQGGSPLQNTLKVAAANPGEWGNALDVAVDYKTANLGQFNLVIRETTGTGSSRQVISSEIHRNLTMDKNSPRYAVDAVNESSGLVQLTDLGLGDLPAATGLDVTVPSAITNASNTDFKNLGSANAASTVVKPDGNDLLAGMETLDTIAPFIFNILCLPDAVNLSDDGADVYSKASKYCEDKRAFLIVDIPETTDTPLEMTGAWLTNVGSQILGKKNAAVYFPRVAIRDSENEGRPRNIGASGTLAGVYARTDAQRGVWKAPAGTEGNLGGVTLTYMLTDLQNGDLNQLGLNALRTFPIFGNVSWGGRTLEGSNQQASEWKYIPVRRTALFIEESLYQGLKWVVFEPNDEPLWAQIRLNVGAFMNNLFRQGAFQGTTPREAYLVKCDRETTTQNDIDNGIVNIVVGFAPLKPAEFVIIKIQQLAGQIAT